MKQIKAYSSLTFSACFLFYLLIATASSAQKQTWKWYFGYNAAMDFSTGAPTVLYNSAMSQYEGSASIADENGNLLFYTDGLSVWNKNHQVMPNGTGMLGNPSSTQSALIIPVPSSDSLYYIFVCDGGTAHYSQLDITLNGGFGDINSIKNIFLAGNCAEKLAGVRAGNGEDIWVAIHENGNTLFSSFLVTSVGVGPAVVSNVGNQLVGNIGQLQFSPDGKKAAMASYSSPTLETVDLFDFDNTTGILSNHLGFPTPDYFQTYGLEFSPNSKVLYSGADPGYNGGIHAWNLEAGSDSAIIASDTIIGYGQGYNNGSFQLAPDGKVYVAQEGSTYIGAISNPNSYYTCSYNPFAVNVSPKMSGLGLPNFLASLFSPVNAEFFCLGDATLFYLNDTSAYSSVYWNFGDPASGNANIDSGAEVYHVFTDTGQYTIEVIENFNGGSTDTVYTTVIIVLAPTVSLGNDTSICIGDTLVLDAGNAGASFLWSNGSTSQTIAVTTTGTYAVSVFSGGCEGFASVIIDVVPCNQPFSASDTSVCQKFCISFFDSSTNNPISWLWLFPGGTPSSSTLQNPANICYNNPGVFDVTLITTSAAGNDTTVLDDYITVYSTPAFPTITVTGDILTSSYASSYQWQFNSVDIPGATNQSYTATQTGYYTVIISDENGCVSSSTVYLEVTGIDEVGNESDLLIYPNPVSNSFTLQLQEGLKGLMGEDISVRLINTLGQEVFSQHAIHFSPSMKMVVDVNALSSGIYFMEVRTEEYFVKKKIIISK